jgi:hypothetical protein
MDWDCGRLTSPTGWFLQSSTAVHARNGGSCNAILIPVDPETYRALQPGTPG